MKKALRREIIETYYYDDKGRRISGVPQGITGDLTGIRGDLTGIRGDIDDCEITDEERKKGIHISDLIVDEDEE